MTTLTFTSTILVLLSMGSMGCLVVAWLLRRPATLAPTKAPLPTPYRTMAQVEGGMVPVDVYGEAIDDWRREYERASKYLAALEAIATLNQDHAAQRIARQALGRPRS